MTLTEIRAWLDEHKGETEVADYLAGLAKVTAEGVKAYLDTDDGKKLMQPSIDRAVTQGIETFKTNNLDRLVTEMHDKKFPPEDERDARIRAIEAEMAETKKQAAKDRLLTTAIKKATEKGLPLSFIDRFLGDDETTTNAHIEDFGKEFKSAVDAAVEVRLKGNGRKPPEDDKPEIGSTNPWKADTRNLTEQGKILKTDPELAKRLMAEAGVK